METQKIRIEDGVGMVLCHDITEILPGEKKGRAFQKGHKICEGDIQKLRSLGKNHIFVLKIEEDEVHEDDAGIILGNVLAGKNVEITPPYESRVNLIATADGLLKINTKALYELNSFDDVVASTLSNYSTVRKGEMVAGTKVVPLVIKKEIMEQVKEIGKGAGAIVSVLPFRPVKVGLIITGTEVFKGIIKDAFRPVLTEKVEALGGQVVNVEYTPDDEERIKEKIKENVRLGCDIILVSGGMSVDPDDVTPKAIRSVAEVVKYGSPVLPGAMFMMSYIGDVAVIGIPACGMYTKVTVLDLIYPRVAAGEIITKKDIISLANGGLCRKCDPCRFPNCSFGRG
ncbi:molybdenum cofactor synthesis domain-containing protein [Anaerosolibacter carboniphilus]|uniref:Molybdopterin molybdenumtransferase n=1 Tax=Anaerosolibacter carboniphilus TaxID=1417629 RepID=A0A841KU07_9FIRM|nr:molybdopterin-binding protein [Anaerosolibacter carboniphilus]MBB6216911.1 molybdenum cofactor synthesis domain-containing protein [Anaerosolibacter carboniphilus]